MIYLLIFWWAFWTPDLLFIMLLGLFALYGMGRRFLIQFGPFILLLLAYDSLRGFAPLINHRVHFTEMINFDQWLFGGVLPTHQLQAWWYHGHVMWYDFYFYFLYMLHFISPIILALAIWRWRPRFYNRYIVALLILSYMAFLTYVAFPAAPPWMASELGYISNVHKISTDVWWAMGVHNFPTIYAKLSPNMVAAVPSLHAAYPTMILLFIYLAFGWRWALAFCWYPISVWIGIVYMGEHYVVDALIGIAYVVIAYGLTALLFRHYGHHARRLGAQLHQAYRRRRPASKPNSKSKAGAASPK